MISIKRHGPIIVVRCTRIKPFFTFFFLLLFCIYFSQSNPYFLILLFVLALIFIYVFFFTSRFEAFVIDERSDAMTLKLKNSKIIHPKILLKDLEIKVRVWAWHYGSYDHFVRRYPMIFTFLSKKNSSLTVPAKFSYLEGIEILDFFSTQSGVTLDSASQYLLKNSLPYPQVLISYWMNNSLLSLFVAALLLLSYFHPGIAKFFLLNNPRVGIIVFLSLILISLLFSVFKKTPLETIYKKVQEIEKKEYESEEKNRYFTGSWK